MRSIVAILLTGVGALAPVAGAAEDATPLDLRVFVDGVPAGRSDNGPRRDASDRIDHVGVV